MVRTQTSQDDPDDDDTPKTHNTRSSSQGKAKPSPPVKTPTPKSKLGKPATPPPPPPLPKQPSTSASKAKPSPKKASPKPPAKGKATPKAAATPSASPKSASKASSKPKPKPKAKAPSKQLASKSPKLKALRSRPSSTDEEEAEEEEEGVEKKEDETLSPTAAARGRSRSPRAPSEGSGTGGDTSLFGRITNGRAAVTTFVCKFIDRCERDGQAGLLELIELIALACHCKNVPSRDKLTDEPADVLTEMAQTMAPESGNYYLLAAPKKWKDRFIDFWYQVVVHARRKLLWESEFMKSLKDWISAIASSKVRAFRHTATVAAYAMMDGLNEIAVNLLTEIDQARRDARRDANRLRPLQSELATVNEHLKDFFESIYGQRFRDIFTTLRVYSAENFGKWAQYYAEFYVGEDRSKYLGWTLCDQNEMVREAALKSVYKMLEVDDQQLGRMKHFVHHYKKRMLEMQRDIKPAVAAQAVRVLGFISSKDSRDLEFLSEEEIQNIMETIMHPEPSVRIEAALFFRRYLRQQYPIAADATDEKVKRNNLERLRMIVQFMDCYPPEAALLPLYVADAFWDAQLGFVFDIEQLMDELLRQVRIESQKAKPLDGKFPECSLLGLVYAVFCKLAKEPVIPRHPAGPPQKLPASLKPKLNAIQMQESLREMSEILAENIEELFAAFEAKPVQFQFLIDCIAMMDLTVFSDRHLEKKFDFILEQLSRHFQATEMERLLESMALCLRSLTSQDTPMKALSEKKALALLRQLQTKLNAATEAVASSSSSLGSPKPKRSRTAATSQSQQSQGAASEDNIEALTLIWKRVSRVYLVDTIDVNAKFWDSVLNALGERLPSATAAPHLQWVVKAAILGIQLRVKAADEDEEGGLDKYQVREELDMMVGRIKEILQDAELSLTNDDRATILTQLCEAYHFCNPATQPIKSFQVVLSEDDVTLLVSQWELVASTHLVAMGAYSPSQDSAKRMLELGWAYHLPLCTAAVARVLPSAFMQPRAVLLMFSDKDPVREVLQMFRKRWRHEHPAQFWEVEWEALRLAFNRFLNAGFHDEGPALAWFQSLAVHLAKEHLPQFEVYKKSGQSGSVPKLLDTALNYVMENFRARYGMLMGLSVYCQKLLKSEAHEVLGKFTRLRSSAEAESVGQEPDAVLKRFNGALMRAAGLSRGEPSGEEILESETVIGGLTQPETRLGDVSGEQDEELLNDNEPTQQSRSQASPLPTSLMPSNQPKAPAARRRGVAAAPTTQVTPQRASRTFGRGAAGSASTSGATSTSGSAKRTRSAGPSPAAAAPSPGVGRGGGGGTRGGQRGRGASRGVGTQVEPATPIRELKRARKEPPPPPPPPVPNADEEDEDLISPTQSSV